MRTTIQSISTKFFALSLLLLSGLYAIAQDTTTSQTTTHVTNSESSGPNPDTAMWYTNPIVWVVAGVVLLIIIIAVARSGKKTVANSEVSRTTTTTTTIKED